MKVKVKCVGGHDFELEIEPEIVNQIAAYESFDNVPCSVCGARHRISTAAVVRVATGGLGAPKRVSGKDRARDNRGSTPNE